MDENIDRRGVIKVAAGAAASASLVAFSRGTSAAAASRGPADLVLHSGRVLVMDRRFSVVEAVAVRQGVVIAAGESRAMRRWIGRRTTTINLRGRTAMPGINDSGNPLVSVAPSTSSTTPSGIVSAYWRVGSTVHHSGHWFNRG